jgi:glycosyltransferase involved in cell wall biosynthesis
MIDRKQTLNNITLFVPSLKCGGAETVMVNLANEFTSRCLSVDLVVLSSNGPLRKILNPDVNVIDLNASRLLTGFIPLGLFLRKKKPKVVISAMKHANIIILVASKVFFTDTLIIVTEHNHVQLSIQSLSRPVGWLIKKLIQLTYPWAKNIVAVSEGVAESLKVLIKFQSNKINVIYNPIIYPGLEKKKKEYPQHRWLIAKKQPVFLAAGRLTDQKDYPNLLRAFSLLVKKVPCKLIILGEGELRMKLERMVKEIGLENSVDLFGFVENPISFMNHCDVFVLSSKWEGFANVIVEAMYCGAKIVSTDCLSGPREILEKGKWGKLVKICDPVELADAMLKSLSLSKLSVEQRANFFSTKRSTDKYLNLIQANGSN